MQPEIPQVNAAPQAPVAPQPGSEQAIAEHPIGTKQYTQDEILAMLRQLMQKPFELANSQGKYDHKPAIGSSLMYINSELAEAHDAYASERHASADDIDICDKFLAEGKDEAFCKYFKSFIKSTFEDEMADIVLMSLSIAGYYNIDIAKHVMLKHRYNQLRQEHSAITTNG